MIKNLFHGTQLVLGLLLLNTTVEAQQLVVYQKPIQPADAVLQAKEIIIKGKVYSADDRSGIPGATARVKVGNKGTTTLPDGTYTLKVHENSTVIFSQMGYLPQEIAVN